MNLPPWENPPADAIVVSGTIDDLAVEHVRDRMERALAACVGLQHVATDESYVRWENHLMFEGTDGVRVTLKPSSDSLIATLSAPTFGLHLKMPAERSGADLSAPDVPACMIRAAIASMDAQRIRSKSSVGTGSIGQELIDELAGTARQAVLNTLHTSCAIIAAANPGRSPDAIVRILLHNPSREARIVDRRSSPLFRRSVERELIKDLPSVMRLSSSTHGYVDFEPAEVGLRHKDAQLDAMSIMRLVAASGIDPEAAVLSAAMAE